MGFERLSVMVVEDSSFARAMLCDILRALRVARVVALSDGAEAITLLRQVSKRKDAAGIIGFDIILSDLVMSPIDGTMLLRWVRQHDDSPDRFVPFVMVSAAAGSEKVREARDLGVTEFLAKPFSVKSVADHLIAVIDNPRPFIYTRDYFGPDRRRQRRPYTDRDRRVATEKDIEIIYSQSKLKSLKPNAQAFVFKLSNRLREKIAGIGFPGPIVVPQEIMEAAEKQLERMESDYSDWVRGTVRQLAAAHKRASDPSAGIRARAEQVVVINRIAHDMRGQGSTFGYPLVTVFGQSLYDCTTNVDEIDDRLLDFVKSHIDGIAAVIRDKVRGDGGGIGAELVENLERARRSFKPEDS